MGTSRNNHVTWLKLGVEFGVVVGVGVGVGVGVAVWVGVGVGVRLGVTLGLELCAVNEVSRHLSHPTLTTTTSVTQFQFLLGSPKRQFYFRFIFSRLTEASVRYHLVT